MAATTDTRDEIVAWRARDGELEPVDLTCRRGLLDHLEQLASDIHPGSALPALAAQLATLRDGGEAILITTADTLADRDFQIALNECQASLFVASVDREGAFQLFHYSGKGRKLVREAHIDLEEVLSRKPTTRLIDCDSANDLPAIFSVDPFPLLLSHPVDENRIWMLRNALGEDIVMAVTRDRRLTCWARPGFGAVQVADDLPAGIPYWHSLDPIDLLGEAMTYAVLHPPNGERLSLLNITANRCEATPFPNVVRGLRAVASHNGALMVILKQGVQVFAVGDTETQQVLNLPTSVVWKRDRFFHRPASDEWLALAYDGVEVRLEPILSGKTGRNVPRLTGVFDRVGHDGPWGVTNKGRLYDSATGQFHRIDSVQAGNLELIAANRWGDRIVIGHPKQHSPVHRHQYLVDVVARKSSRAFHDPVASIDAQRTYRLIHQRTLRSRISGVFEDNGLVLVSQKGSCHRLQHSQHCVQIQYASGTARTSIERFAPWRASRCNGNQAAKGPPFRRHGCLPRFARAVAHSPCRPFSAGSDAGTG